MNFLETRITKLETQFEEKDMDVSDVELFDIHGNKVNAKILRMPMDWECGLAVLQNGTEKEIECIGNFKDITFEAEKLLNEGGKIDENEAKKVDYSDKLFLRRNGQKSVIEILFGANKND